MDELGDYEVPDATRGEGVSLASIPLHSTNLLTVLDENGTIRYESPSVERLYGYDQGELVGEQVTEYFHPEDREDVLDAFRAVVDGDGNRVETVEYRHERADGTYLWVESAASSNPTPEGHYVVNTRDISARKERERELERTNERLETFASVVSHDLRNPLNVAQLRLEMARSECESPHLDDVAHAHDRMETLVNDLLVLARQGEAAAETEPVRLGPVAESAWKTVATADATLEVTADRQVDAHPSRLAQLFENLMHNAVEHGEEPTVTVALLGDGSGFYVADDGPGIDPAVGEDAFDSGYSTDESGTGLGLTIVREIASAHGWESTLTESAAGGARFEFTGVEFVDR